MLPQDRASNGTRALPLREAERKPVRFRCEARIGQGAWSLVFLRDLSTHGFQMSRVLGLDICTRIRIKVPGLELLSATVRWVGEEHAGCAFSRPLSDCVLDHLARQTML